MTERAEIRNEELLMLRLCRLYFSPDHIKEIREIISSVSDWNYFASQANEHGVIALVYHNLKKLDLLTMVPEAVVSELNNKYLVSLSRNVYHTTVITGVVKSFSENKIKLVLLKGLALEHTVYGNAGLRQMTDIDFLIDRKDYREAQSILIKEGYTQMPVKSVFHKPIITFIGKHLPSFIKEGASIDIHLELFPGTRNDLTRQILDTSQGIKINNQSVPIPKPQLFFIYLINHLWTHELNNESQLRLYTDLAVMLEEYYEEIINDRLFDLAARAGLSEVLAGKLMLLEEFWSFSFSENLDLSNMKTTKHDSERRFFSFLKRPKNNPVPDKSLLYKKTISEIPGFHRKVLYITGDIFPTLSFMKERYHCGSRLTAVLYYPHRLGKVLWLLWG